MHPFFAFPFAHGYHPCFGQPLHLYTGTCNLYTHWGQNLSPYLDNLSPLRPLARLLRPCLCVNNQRLALKVFPAHLNTGYNCQLPDPLNPFLYVRGGQIELLAVLCRCRDWYRGLPYWQTARVKNAERKEKSRPVKIVLHIEQVPASYILVLIYQPYLLLPILLNCSKRAIPLA